VIAVEIINRQRKKQFTKEMRAAIPLVARAVAERIGFTGEAEVTLTLVSDGPIRVLNREERGVDRATDILSFPFLQWDEGTMPPLSPFDRNPETGRIMLGDLVLSLERAYAQAEEYGHSPLRETAFLCVHGLLHLVGYDHIEQEEPMFTLQREILDSLKLTRDV